MAWSVSLAHFLGTAAVLVAGCGGATSDKAAGDAAREPRFMRLANANSGPAELESYARAVDRASHGRLRIEFVNRPSIR